MSARRSPPTGKSLSGFKIDPYLKSKYVYGLNVSNFPQFIQTNDFAVILFYDPCDEKTPKVTPQFVKAAQCAAERDYVYAAVDCKKEWPLCANQKAFSLPIYKYFFSGRESGKHSFQKIRSVDSGAYLSTCEDMLPCLKTEEPQVLPGSGDEEAPTPPKKRISAPPSSFFDLPPEPGTKQPDKPPDASQDYADLMARQPKPRPLQKHPEWVKQRQPGLSSSLMQTLPTKEPQPRPLQPHPDWVKKRQPRYSPALPLPTTEKPTIPPKPKAQQAPQQRNPQVSASVKPPHSPPCKSCRSGRTWQPKLSAVAEEPTRLPKPPRSGPKVPQVPDWVKQRNPQMSVSLKPQPSTSCRPCRSGRTWQPDLGVIVEEP